MSNEPLIFNPVDPAYVADPYPFFRRLRSEAPVYWWERGHMWLVSRYADVEATLKHPRLSTNARDWRFYQDRMSSQLPPEVLEYFDNRLFFMNPADHARVRKLVASSFTPRAAERREAMIREVADELLDTIDPSAGFDLVQDFANHVPARIIGRMLGIPPEHVEVFRQWSDAVVQVTFPLLPPEQYLAIAQRLVPGFALLRQVIEERREQPGDDLLSALVQAEEQGDRLSLAELVALVGGLITGGSETTAHLLAFAVIELSRHPEVLARVRAEPQRLPGLVEETLRHDNFSTMGVPRYALDPVEIRGQPIAKGDMVMCMISAAMHDEDVWPDAERFDIDRDPTPSLVFGRGAHFCLGAHLARVEGRVALEALLERCPTLELAAPPVFRPHPFLRCMASLPLRPQPAA